MYLIANVSPQDLVFLFVVALVVFGPKRMPEVGRQVAHALRDLKKLSQEFTGALLGVQEQVHGTIAPVISGVSGVVSGVSERVMETGMHTLPPGTDQEVGGAVSTDLMTPKAEFGEEESHRSRRGVTLSTLPPESKGEA